MISPEQYPYGPERSQRALRWLARGLWTGLIKLQVYLHPTDGDSALTEHPTNANHQAHAKLGSVLIDQVNREDLHRLYAATSSEKVIELILDAPLLHIED